MIDLEIDDYKHNVFYDKHISGDYLHHLGDKPLVKLSSDERKGYYTLYGLIGKVKHYTESLPLKDLSARVFYLKVYRYLMSLDLHLDNKIELTKLDSEILYGRRIIAKRIVKAIDKWHKKNRSSGYCSVSECFQPGKGLHSLDFPDSNWLSEWLVFKELCNIKVNITTMCNTLSERLVITYQEDYADFYKESLSPQPPISITELEEIEKELKGED